MSEPSAMPLVCVEFYGSADPRELLAAVDAPAGQERTCAIQIGQIICRLRARDSINAVMMDADGDVLERMIITRKAGG